MIHLFRYYTLHGYGSTVRYAAADQLGSIRLWFNGTLRGNGSTVVSCCAVALLH
ncbi:hypothetical protein [Sphingobacterium siyangense]|uniref:hypothetical protein n=1 Tax=Sphingobacterium siyangense TaxID=459529 RepID=UPI002FD9D4EB